MASSQLQELGGRQCVQATLTIRPSAPVTAGIPASLAGHACPGRRLMARDAAGNWIGYGPGDSSPEVAKIEHRLLAAYPTNSHAQALGVKEDQLYTDETAAAVKELAKFVNNDPTLLERMAGGKRLARAEDLGVADLAFRKAIGAYIPPDAGIPPGHRSKYPIQGVWATRARSSTRPRRTVSSRPQTNSAMSSCGCTARWPERPSGSSATQWAACRSTSA